MSGSPGQENRLGEGDWNRRGEDDKKKKNHILNVNNVMIYTRGGKGYQEGRRLINGPSAQNNVILMTIGSIHLHSPQLLQCFSPLYDLKMAEDKHHICLPE